MPTISETIAAYEKRLLRRKAVNACNRRKRALQGNGAACNDSYYEKLGALIEAHPIASARAPRG